MNLGYLSILLAFTHLYAAACSHSPNYDADPQETEALHYAIVSLSDNVKEKEAEALSTLLISSTLELANEYRMASPPRYHNLLVHLSIRDRGLCCHWAEDLRLRINKFSPQTLNIDWLVTKHGDLLEHNSIVIFAADTTWKQGIVYDPWRASGQPYWVLVEDDKFIWKQHPLSGDWEQLHCK